MTHPHARELSTAELVSALLVGTVGVLMVGVQPIVLGALVDAHQVTLEGVGLVAMGEIIALGLGVALGDILLPVTHVPRVTLWAALCAAALNLLSTTCSGDVALLAMRALTGLAEGGLVWGTTAVVVRSANPPRMGAVYFVVQTLAQALLGAVLAHGVIPAWGWPGAFQVLAVTCLMAAVLAWWQPRHLKPLAPATLSGFEWTTSSVLPLAAVFCQLATLGAFWAYLEPMGQAVGLDAQAAQSLVSVVLVMQVLGGALSTLLVRRLPPLAVLMGASVVLGSVVLYIQHLHPGETQGFVVACAVFGLVWLFMLPFHIGLALRADPSGRLASLVPAAQLLGSAMGPLVASVVVVGEDASAVPWVSSGFAVVTCVLLGAWKLRTTTAPGN